MDHEAVCDHRSADAGDTAAGQTGAKAERGSLNFVHMFDTNRTFLEGLRGEPHRLMHVQGSALPFLPAAV